MTTQSKTIRQSPEQGNENLRRINYKPIGQDYGNYTVVRTKDDGTVDIIGYLYTEIEGEETRYVTMNKNGRELFPRTDNFNTVDQKFERFSRLIEMEEKADEFYLQQKNNNYSQSKKQNTMQTKSQTTEQKKFNQLVFVEYEKPTKDGHFITIVDSYKNNIGKIHKNWNEETRKYDYTSFDHAGNQIGKSEKIWELKNEYLNNREQLLKDAHLRRLDSKEQTNQAVGSSENKDNQRKKETENLRQSKLGKEIKTEKGDKTKPERTKPAIANKNQENNSEKVKGNTIEDSSEEQERNESLDELRDIDSQDPDDHEYER